MKQRVAKLKFKKKKKKEFKNRRRYDMTPEDQSSDLSQPHHEIGLLGQEIQVGEANVEIAMPNAPVACSTPRRSEASTSSHGHDLQSETSTIVSRSKQKLANSSLVAITESQSPTKKKPVTRRAKIISQASKRRLEEPSGMSIMDTKILAAAIISSAICKNCKNPRSKLTLLSTCKKSGLAEHFRLVCSVCQSTTKFSTSNKANHDQSYEVNLRSVNASLPIGHAGLSKFCTKMNLPQPVTSKPYNYLSKKLEKSGTISAERIMKEAAERLCNRVMEEEPDNCEVAEDGRILANVAVTVDGTWQKRGHSSKIGVVLVVSVLTGEILDFEVKSLFCHACQQRSTLDRNSKQYIDWMAVHKKDCCCNFEGSSGEMEVKGAMDIFSRSIESRNLKYTTFVGDGDSGCFGKVQECLKEKYGSSYIIRKEECVGHLQKRIGTALNVLALNLNGEVEVIS